MSFLYPVKIDYFFIVYIFKTYKTIMNPSTLSYKLFIWQELMIKDQVHKNLIRWHTIYRVNIIKTLTKGAE